MIKYLKRYNIMDLNFEIQSQIPFCLVDTYDKFEIQDNVFRPDIMFQIMKAEHIDLEEYKFISTIKDSICYSYYENDKEKLKVAYHEKNPSAIRWYIRQEKNRDTIFRIYVSDNWKMYLNNLDPFILLGLSEFLCNKQAFLLHASVVKFKDYGFVFTAPSGTGKSTQAELWEKHYNAKILNGDRALIRKTHLGYNVYGSPYAGSSYIYENEGVPLKAIFIIRQAEYNKITKMASKDKFVCLLSEILYCKTDKEVAQKQMDNIMELITSVPVYLFECKPNKDAVDAAYNLLEEVE